MTMVDISQVFTGSTFKAADVEDNEPVLTISKVDIKEFEDGNKLNVHFVDEKKTLICNATNAKKIAKAFGTNTDAWVGKKIQLYNDPDIEFGGRPTGGIRVRTGKQPAPQRQPDFDDPVELDNTF